MTMLGADTQGLRAFARQLKTRGERLAALAQQLEEALATTRWLGPDAGLFRQEWTWHRERALRGWPSPAR